MSLQRQHFLLSYLKTLSFGPSESDAQPPEPSGRLSPDLHVTVWHKTGQAKKAPRGRRMQNITCSQLTGFIIQLVEHCTDIADVMGLNPLEAFCIFHVPVRDNNYCLNCPDKCQDDLSFSSEDFSA